MYLYFESNKDGLSAWYESVGGAIKDHLINEGYQCQHYSSWDEPDYRIDVKCDEMLLQVIVVVYEENPINGSVTYEGEKAENLKRELNPKIMKAVSNIQEITACEWLAENKFREFMGWPHLT